MYPPNQGGMRTTDRGSTTGAASWTDRAHSERAAPKGRAKRVNPPLTAIFNTKSITYNVILVLPCIKCCIKKLV
ncbi:hypothetical protein AXM47_09320 [Salmonella enterica subsp. enterica]|uniref:Uncharacterized protein n=1 Tax=Salmonella enterica subsp. enterica serovar Kentucky TaxID=192955 RepID=A0A5W2R9W3_SALET|nr:hypothetical protein [Salmonella enterica subsp. enterica]EAB6004446.1 hypothetical protein [Salmonella enterica subsp. enterica serovar Kentucky]EAO9403954.1 hypothetical protein [Salmonella enterica]EAA5848102.1 hypothetical protein [Salmonella enterica subsp. enterica]EAA5892018.1 hypothetical protein [Salmonella enterica subsp. enterica]